MLSIQSPALKDLLSLSTDDVGAPVLWLGIPCRVAGQ